MCRIVLLIILNQIHQCKNFPIHWKAHPDEIQILMAVVKYKTKMQLPRCGVCSNWLASLSPNCNGGQSVPIWISSGTINLPKELHTPVLMIGPGTYAILNTTHLKCFISSISFIIVFNCDCTKIFALPLFLLHFHGWEIKPKYFIFAVYYTGSINMLYFPDVPIIVFGN